MLKFCIQIKDMGNTGKDKETHETNYSRTELMHSLKWFLSRKQATKREWNTKLHITLSDSASCTWLS